MRLYIVYGDEFAERVVGNLCNLSTFWKERARPEFNEPILHIADYNIREAVKDAIERARRQQKLET